MVFPDTLGRNGADVKGPAQFDGHNWVTALPMQAGEAQRPLRRGWTTGTCATAAAAAAYQGLLTGSFPDPVDVLLPRGGIACLALARAELGAQAATASIVKDAGDDPDVTNGAEVVVTVSAAPPGHGIVFRGGEGVGRVTLPGLPVPPGEPAINPGPRGMISRTLGDIAERCGVACDVTVTIAIPGGETLAAKTLNGRLGIIGGLSILGTTGIVVPFSCAAWIHSIHRGIDVARAAGLTHLAAATGSTSEAAVAKLYDLPDVALIDMGDFAGGTLKYLRAHPVERLTLAGGFGKLVKMAQGHLFLHSAKSRVEMKALLGLLQEAGASQSAMADAQDAQTAAQVLRVAQHHRLRLADRIASLARLRAAEVLGNGMMVEVIVFDRSSELIGRAGFDA